MKIKSECPKCGNRMEKGFLHHHHKNLEKKIIEANQIRWASGEPVVNSWTQHVKLTDKTVLSVVTYRCTACGYLENYAFQEK